MITQDTAKMDLYPFITTRFSQKFGGLPKFVVRSPGRVNLIGEHTDYNDGFVLPMAIDRAIWMAIQPRDDRRVLLYSVDFDSPADFFLDRIEHESDWGEYVRGVAWALLEAGFDLRGWQGILASNLPVGAGLSSSAALEMAVAKAFSLTSNWPFDPAQMATTGQRAENEWVGANTGIMDQMISAAGKADHALLIDCRDLSTQQIPLPTDTVIIIMDTTTRRKNTDSSYNERRKECEAAAAYFGVTHLRDVSIERFRQGAGSMDNLLMRRAQHVITENARVLKATQALSSGNAHEMGKLMNESHISMRDDFEITNQELNYMVDFAQAQEGCYGARMTGGGFGGCAVGLVLENKVESFVTNIRRLYSNKTSLEPNIYVCKASNGTEGIQISQTNIP